VYHFTLPSDFCYMLALYVYLRFVKVKVKKVNVKIKTNVGPTWICIALYRQHLTLSALSYGSRSFTCKLHHACLYLVGVHQTAPSLTCNGRQLIAAYYLLINPERMKGWVDLGGWLIADGLPMYMGISGWRWAQDGESSPVQDQHSIIVQHK